MTVPAPATDATRQPQRQVNSRKFVESYFPPRRWSSARVVGSGRTRSASAVTPWIFERQRPLPAYI